MASTNTEHAASVLCIDDDRDVAEIVQAVLTDEGYRVSCLYALEDDALMRAIGRLEPDVVLLDSGDITEYGPSWAAARAIHDRPRRIPVVMFTAHQIDVKEAQKGESERALAADFAAVLPKPFHLDELLGAVATAAGQGTGFDRSAGAEENRTRELVKALERHGAKDVNPSRMREWATFRDKKGRLLQLYWWQARGVYQVGRYNDQGAMTMLGQFVDRDAAIEIALPS